MIFPAQLSTTSLLQTHLVGCNFQNQIPALQNGRRQAPNLKLFGFYQQM